jgi:hypothetical protein
MSDPIYAAAAANETAMFGGMIGTAMVAWGLGAALLVKRMIPRAGAGARTVAILIAFASGAMATWMAFAALYSQYHAGEGWIALVLGLLAPLAWLRLAGIATWRRWRPHSRVQAEWVATPGAFVAYAVLYLAIGQLVLLFSRI